MATESPREVIVIGAGGHAKVVISVLQATGAPIAGLYDDKAELAGSRLLGVPVLGPIAAVAELHDPSAVVGVGNNAARRRIVEGLPDVRWEVAVHPTAYVHETVTLGPGSVVFAGAIIQPDTHVGRHAIINTAASIDHDCVIGAFVHAGPGVRLAGGVRVGASSLLGAGSVVLPGVTIGGRTLLGGGAVAVRDLEGGHVYVGVPAKTIREQ